MNTTVKKSHAGLCNHCIKASSGTTGHPNARRGNAASGSKSATSKKSKKHVSSSPKMHTRRQTVEHPFGTIKSWMGYTHFLMKTLKRVRTEMALHVLAYNIKRVMAIMGIGPLMAVIKAA